MIIDGRQTPRKRLLEYVTTAGGWLLMLGFGAQFLLSAVLWFFGVVYLRRYLWVPGEALATWHVILVTLIVATLNILGMGLWGTYNRRRYGSLRRRRMPPPLTVEEMARLFDKPENVVKQLHTARWMDYAEDVTLPLPSTNHPPNTLP